MKITDERKDNKVAFCELSYGDIFTHGEFTLMKIVPCKDEKDCDVNAVTMTMGFPHYLNDDYLVTPLVAELIIRG